ncbi:MAG: efflux RND transporter periplasmic adaptor subunit [Thermodesulfobacteriota bacterium]|nr:efflux RND transporter periplasmic adaptor subunit [Thermodesulfobacteriota bacterium]
MNVTVFFKLTFYFTTVLLFLSCGNEKDKATEAYKISIDPSYIKNISHVMVKNFFKSIGTVESKTSTKISSKIVGHVQMVKVKEGDKVKKGDLLISLRSNELKARLDESENVLLEMKRSLSAAEAAKEEADALLTLASVTYKRFKELKEKESISIQEFDEIKAQYEVARARINKADEAIAAFQAKKRQAESSLKAAETYYEYTKIRAPFSGVITQKSVNKGDLASPGFTLMILEDYNNYRLKAVVDESKVKKITLGQKVDIVIEALSEERIEGRVKEIIPRVDPVTRKFLVKIDLPLISGIMSGMYGKAYFPMEDQPLLLVPQKALSECGQLSSLFVVNENGVVERRLVKVGKRYGDNIEILSGISPDESIIVDKLYQLTEGCILKEGK